VEERERQAREAKLAEERRSELELRRSEEERLQRESQAARSQRFEAAIARAKRLEQLARAADEHRVRTLRRAAFVRWRDAARGVRERRERHFAVLRQSGMGAPAMAIDVGDAHISVASDDRLSRALLAATAAARRPTLDVAGSLTRGWLARDSIGAGDSIVLAVEGDVDTMLGKARQMVAFADDVDGAARRAPARDFALPLAIVRGAEPSAHCLGVVLDGSDADADRLAATLKSIVAERVYAFADDFAAVSRGSRSAVLVAGPCYEDAAELLDDLEGVCDDLQVHFRRDDSLSDDSLVWLGQHASTSPVQRQVTTLAAVVLRALQVGVAPLLRHYSARDPVAVPSLAFLLRQFNTTLDTLSDQIESRCTAEDDERTRLLAALADAKASLPSGAPPALPSAPALSRWLREETGASDAVCDVLRVHFARSRDAADLVPWDAVFAAIVDEKMAPFESESLSVSDNFQVAIPVNDDGDDSDDDWIFVGALPEAIVERHASGIVASERDEPMRDDKENEPAVQQLDEFTVWLRRALQDGEPAQQQPQPQQQQQQRGMIIDEDVEHDDLMSTFGMAAAVVRPPPSPVKAAPPRRRMAPVPDVSQLIQVVRNERRAWRADNALWQSENAVALSPRVAKRARTARVTQQQQQQQQAPRNHMIFDATRMEMILDL
jgi:hypothetical protein